MHKLATGCTGDCSSTGRQILKVFHKQGINFTGLGNWIFKECTQILKITFFSNLYPKQEKSYVWRYFSTSLQILPMLTVKRTGRERARNIKPKRSEENVVL